MGQLSGIYRATVSSSADPMGQGRVQVTAPAVGLMSQWALPCRPPGPSPLGRRNVDGVPATGATVWVMFEGGDLARPVWLGVL